MSQITQALARFQDIRKHDALSGKRLSLLADVLDGPTNERFIAASNWHELGDGPAVPGNDKALALLHTLKQLWQVGFCLVSTDF